MLSVEVHLYAGPFGAPTNVSVQSIGNNSVRVSWSPPAGDVVGYRVFYSDGSATNTLTVNNVSTAVVGDLTLGVQYTITVQAFADFPSQNSTAYSIALMGETGVSYEECV